MMRPLCALLSLISSFALAADWPQFRGPELTGSIRGENIIPGEKFGLEIVWKKSLGSGYAGVSIAGELAVTMFSDAESDILVALNAQSGEEIWRYVLGPVYKGHSGSDDGPSSTPTIHDSTVYALDTHGILVAVTLDKGEKIWQRKLGEDLVAHVPHYGFNTVPTIAGSSLIIMTGDKEGRAATALDLKTGETKWSVGNDTNTYQSPYLWKHKGGSTLLAMTDNHLLGINPDDGSLRWQHDHTLQDAESFGFPLPVDDHSFLLTSLRGSMVLELENKGAEAKTRWNDNVFMNTYAIPVIHGGYLYGYNAQFLSCVNPADGNVMWRSRPPGGRGLSLIQNMIFSVSNQGDLVAVAAKPDQYEEAARLPVFDQASYTPVSYGAGLIFTRNLKEIAAVRFTDKPTLVTATAGDNTNEQFNAIRYVEGPWNVVTTFFEDGKWGTPSPATRTLAESAMGGAFIRLNTPVPFAGATFQFEMFRFEMTLSYDRFNHVYRVAFLDDLNGYMDIYTGQIKDGILTIENTNTGTAFPDGNGGFVYGKLEIQPTEDGFSLHAYTSGSVEGPFVAHMKLEFTAVADNTADRK